MPRPKRLNIPGMPQHVTQRGNNRQPCFADSLDYRLYLELLKRSCQKHYCRLHAYVLMGNHVHLLLTPDIVDGVSLMIRDLGRDYVLRFNKRHERTGTLWEGRFKSSLIDSDRYMLACYRYIELNPVRAQMVKHPADHPWSSFSANGLGHANAMITPHQTWLALGANDLRRRHSYLRLFDTVLPNDLLAQIRFGLRKGLPTGNERFMEQIEGTLGIKLGTGKRGRPVQNPLE
ncbi:MAG: transposase [Xanthomonadales bacterium]|nr:transposase [Xanthomonadales bacterium]